jgi:hypothetical protein
MAVDVAVVAKSEVLVALPAWLVGLRSIAFEFGDERTPLVDALRQRFADAALGGRSASRNLVGPCSREQRLLGAPVIAGDGAILLHDTMAGQNRDRVGGNGLCHLPRVAWRAELRGYSAICGRLAGRDFAQDFPGDQRRRPAS